MTTLTIIGFQNTSALIIEESEGKIKNLTLQKNIHVDKITSIGTFWYEAKQYFFTGSFDKWIKVWNLETGSETLNLINSSALQKKVTHTFYSSALSSLFVSDKYGDIYSFSLSNILRKDIDLFPEYQNSNNLAIQQSFKDISLDDGQEFVVLGDSYSKIKMFDLKNMHDLVNVWVPFEGHLVQIQEFKSVAVFLYQMKDSHTLEKRYVVHQVDKNKLNSSNYEGTQIDTIQFPNDTIKARIEIKNETEFVIFTLTKTQIFGAQVYNLHDQALTKQQSTQLVFNLSEESSLYLHSAHIQGSSLAVVGIKVNTPTEEEVGEIQPIQLPPSGLESIQVGKNNILFAI